MLQAIQTAYKGYNFRSRLEARWAVLFDALKLAWQYEPEGYILHDGHRYLPDFTVRSIPGAGLRDDAMYWVEVKGAMPFASEVQKLQEVCSESRQRGYMLIGTPGEHRVIEIDAEGTDYPPVLYPEFRLGDFDLFGAPFKAPAPGMEKLAIRAARSARFEHGQKGATL